MNNPNFTALDVVKNSGLAVSKASYRTFVTHLHRMGFSFRQTKKKELLSHQDYTKRLQFARQMSEEGCSYWTQDVSFFPDGVPFVYKTNPLGEAIRPNRRLW